MPRSAHLLFGLLGSVLLALPGASHGCGEGMFNAGKGLPFQSYLAPHQARILILADTLRGDAAFRRGIEQAGHSVVVVDDMEALRRALREARYDIVIGSVDAAERLAEADDLQAVPTMLPVVARAERNSPRVRDRFALFVLDGASLGQLLDTINRALARSG